MTRGLLVLVPVYIMQLCCGGLSRDLPCFFCFVFSVLFFGFLFVFFLNDVAGSPFFAVLPICFFFWFSFVLFPVPGLLFYAV
jgi:hypothetical protein